MESYYIDGGRALRITFGIMALAILLLAGGVSAATLTVNVSGGADYTKIQDAIDNASAGDTILVYSGTYYENVNVNKQLILRGIDNSGGKPVVDVKGTGYAIILRAGNSTLEGFMVINATSEAGIYSGSGNSTFINNTVSNNKYGIYLEYGDNQNNKLNSNIVWSNEVGIYLYYSGNNTLISNNVSNNLAGISLFSSSNNSLIKNQGDISLLDSNYNVLSSNNASNKHYDGIHLYSSSYNTLSNNTVSNNRNGIYIVFSSNNMLSGNNVASNEIFGISQVFSSNTSLTNNNISNNSVGIYLWNSSGNTIIDNNSSKNSIGINLNYFSNNNILIDNIVNFNYYGIFLDTSTNNILTGNTANLNSYYGTYLNSSRNNILSSNNISNNLHYGILLNSSSNNTIYNNYFNNTNNGFDDGINLWNITKTPRTNIINGAFLGGNFWSDYSGNDTDGDGLGDTMLPYNSSGRIANGGDYLPLTSSPIHFAVNINISGIPVIGHATGKILKVEYTNFNSGDPYNISIKAPNGTRVYYDNGTLIGKNLEIIPIKWTPSTKGDHTIEAWGRGMINSTPVFIFDSEVVSPVPEFGTILLVAIGMLGLIGIRRRY